MKRIYLDTNVWCRPFDKPSERISKEVEAFLKSIGRSFLKKIYHNWICCFGCRSWEYRGRGEESSSRRVNVYLRISKST